MKKCGTCGVLKKLSFFWKSSQTKDGLRCFCIDCGKKKNAVGYKKNRESFRKRSLEYYEKNREIVKARTRKWRLENIVKAREYGRQYYANSSSERREKFLASKRKYDRTERGRIQSRKYRQGEKWVARYTFRNAIRDGRIQKGECCQLCLSTVRVEGHHSDYSKPLEVIWVCRKCHSALHRSMRARQNM